MAMHAEIYRELSQLKEQSLKCGDMQELADRAYALRDMHKYVDDLRKELDQTKSVCERIACLLWAKDSEGDPIRTDHCTASPKIKYMASLPSRTRDPEAYANLMGHLGIPDGLLPEDVVRPHWPGFVNYMTRLAEEGLPLPEGIDVDKTYPVYSLTIRGKKGVNED
jgi:hypothetical protein